MLTAIRQSPAMLRLAPHQAVQRLHPPHLRTECPGLAGSTKASWQASEDTSCTPPWQ